MLQIWVTQWTDWWATVPAWFAVLLALPFGIAAIVLLADGVRERRQRRSARSPT
ncbi:MAG TPA: hypothetical protein PK359_13460 [Burkholderiaceae bacterium]|jgi:hypothetical protein|nr:hypothetical protein [Burkholderiaceae bacterium]